MEVNLKQVTTESSHFMVMYFESCPLTSRPHLHKVSNMWSRLVIRLVQMITAEVCQPWMDPHNCYFEYLIIHFDYLL